jgi:hypothetical protein
MLIFGSELKSLLVHPRLKRDIDPQAVEGLFRLWLRALNHARFFAAR